MRWKRACTPVGKGTQGMITGNVVRSGRVKRGAQSGFVLDAPPGTRFAELQWAGDWRRRDCRYALQFYAWRPDGPADLGVAQARQPQMLRGPGTPQASQRKRRKAETTAIPRSRAPPS